MADKVAALREKGDEKPARDVDVSNHLLFEVCSEIGRQGRCLSRSTSRIQQGTSTNTTKVGGVHTVLKTKAPVTTPEYGDRYTLLGRLETRTVSTPTKKKEQPQRRSY